MPRTRSLSWYHYLLALIIVAAFVGVARGNAWVLIILFCGAAWALMLRFDGQMATVRRAAQRFASGDFSQRLAFEHSPELAGLGASINSMAKSLDARLREITQQRNEREAILSSMREGVMAVDRDERILMLNQAAERILGIPAAGAVGKLVQERLRNVELHEFLKRSLGGEDVPEEESYLHWGDSRLLQAESAPLLDEEGRERGILLVFNDVTQLHRLETMRRDFVANVSHELRTPITSIKGFVETLRDGAIEDPENAVRFLEIIGRHADRLSAIIEDLLALSRIERQQEAEGITRKKIALIKVIDGAIENSQPRAEMKQIKIESDCPDTIELEINELLIEQAIGNLLENAIKYSPEGARVALTARLDEARGEASIEVRDTGPGIEPQHLPRLFERFYRADPARSRDLGGTGLGLAIVKHIIQAHGGRISVQSEIGRGSVFTMVLPVSHS